MAAFSIESDNTARLTLAAKDIGAEAALESDHKVTQELKLTFNYTARFG